MRPAPIDISLDRLEQAVRKDIPDILGNAAVTLKTLVMSS